MSALLPEQELFFESFYRKHFEELTIYAFYYTRDWTMARYAAQDAFHVAVDKIDTFSSSPNPMGWMKKTVEYTAKNMMRAKKRQLQWLVSLEDLWDGPGAYDHYEVEDEQVNQCERILSPEEFRLLKRIALDKIPYVEVAEELGISMWACRKRVQRIEEKLRDKLDKKP